MHSRLRSSIHLTTLSKLEMSFLSLILTCPDITAVRTSKRHTTQSLVKLVTIELNNFDTVLDKTADTNIQVNSDVSKRQQCVPRRDALMVRDTIREIYNVFPGK